MIFIKISRSLGSITSISYSYKKGGSEQYQIESNLSDIILDAICAPELDTKLHKFAIMHICYN